MLMREHALDEVDDLGQFLELVFSRQPQAPLG